MSEKHRMGPSMSACRDFHNNGTGGPIIGAHYCTIGPQITVQELPKTQQ